MAPSPSPPGIRWSANYICNAHLVDTQQSPLYFLSFVKLESHQNFCTLGLCGQLLRPGYGKPVCVRQ